MTAIEPGPDRQVPEGGWPDDLFGVGVAPTRVEMETENGPTLTLPCSRWHRRADRADLAVLTRCRGSILDVGCGPGRHVAALVSQRRHVLGIDTSPAAVATTRRRGGPAVRTSVFEAVPRAGRWDTALLLDGNIGIGGDIPRLLDRVRALLHPGGRTLVETTDPRSPSGAARVRIHHSEAIAAGQWFPWAWTTPADLGRHAAASGMAVGEVWSSGGRWFVQLHAA